MNTTAIILIIFGVLILAAIITIVVIILVRKDKIKFKSCTAQFGSSSNIIGVWTSDNTTAVVNMYASTGVLSFDNTGMPSSPNNSSIFSSPPNTPISSGTISITSIQTNKSYNTYFVASDSTDNTRFTVCGPVVVNSSLNNRKMIISLENLSNKGGITRNSSTNEITYIINNSITPTSFNTWLYNGPTPSTLTVSSNTETIPANTLSNTNTNGTRYYLYNDNNTLKAATLSTISNNLSNSQFTFLQGNWTLSNTSNFGIGIAGTIVSGSTITFSTPPNDSWINNIVS